MALKKPFSTTAAAPLPTWLSLPRAFQPVIRILDIVTHCRIASRSCWIVSAA
jgi:hypothetical protein